MDLNEQQKSAVTHTGTPLLIIAGAGTGKTTVVTKRIEYLIKKKEVKSDEILALTFTEKAAGEMMERLDQVMPYGYEEPWISTFHSFCDRLLKLEGLEIGLNTDYKILPTARQWLLLKKNLFDMGLKYYLPLNNPNKFISALLTFFSRLQDEDVNESEIRNFQLPMTNDQFDGDVKENHAKYKEVFEAYKKYQELKLKENVLDFGDLNWWVLKLFRERPAILKKYQKKFKYMLVDEFQDTNYAQLQLIKMLCGGERIKNQESRIKNKKERSKNSYPELTVVGDDDQSIYAFRGSSVHNILDFKDQFSNAKEVVLTTNYRSGQPILNTSYSSIQFNNPDRLEEKLKIDKKLVSARGKKFPKPQVIEVEALETEAEFVVSKILELVGQDYTYQDVAILARANAHLDPFVGALKRTGLPYQLLGNRGLFDQEEVRDLFFFLRVVIDKSDSNSLFYLLHNDVFGIEGSYLLEMLHEAKRQSVDLWEVVVERGKINKKLMKFINYIDDAQRKDAKKSVVEILHKFIDDSGFVKQFLQEESLENQLKVKNLNLFFEKLKAFDDELPNASMADCLEYFDLLVEAGENPAQAQIEDVDTVNLLTIHSSKGLEWPIVFVVNLVSDRFPTRRRSDPIALPEEFVKQSLPTGNFHIQEERRLFYVALTRAKDFLFMTYGKKYGGVREKKPSIFLKELYDSPLKLKPTVWESEPQQLSFLGLGTGVKAPKPKEVLDGKINLTHVSYTQIDAYKTCPLRYKYSYVLQVPIRPHHSMSYGRSIHSTLQKFHNFEIAGQKPDLEVLLHIYDKEFQESGYETEEHKRQTFESGRESLTQYFNTYKETFEGEVFDQEKAFRIPIDGVSLIGRIDRIDIVGDKPSLTPPLEKEENQNGRIEVIDYKTGKSKDQKTVDKDAQLTIYAMAVKQLFGKLPESLCLYFVNDGIKVNTKRTEAQINKKKKEISEAISLIKAGEFKAKPGFGCKYCPYNKICPEAVR